MEPTKSRKNIAVLAVHGVGDQQPFETARRISDLLQDLDDGEPRNLGSPTPDPPTTSVTPQYSPFVERTVRINVRPVVVSGPAVPLHKEHGPFAAWVASRGMADRSPAVAAPGESGVESRRRPLASAEDEASLEFMRGQLRGFSGETAEETYETIRVEGTRLGADPRVVHVYELYWADLSRLKAGLLSIFTELYQLLFHLASLGTHAVDAEAAVHRTPAWMRFRRAQADANYALSVPVPVMTFVMLGLAAVIAAQAALYRLPAAWQAVSTMAVMGAGLAVAAGYGAWRRDAANRWLWSAPLVGWLVFLGAVTWFRNQLPATATHLVAVGALLGIAAGLVWLALRAYDARQPGVLGDATSIVMALFLLALVSCAVRPWTSLSSSRILDVLVRVYEVAYGLLVLAWFIVGIEAVWTWWTSRPAIASLESAPAEQAVARRSRWTAFLTMGVSALIFLIVTLIGWGLMATAIRPLVNSVSYVSLLFTGTDTVGDLIGAFLEVGVWVTLPLLLAVALLAALPSIWGLLPSVLTEVWCPSIATAQKAPFSQSLGSWLTTAFAALKVAGVVVNAVLIAAVPVAAALFVVARYGPVASLLPPAVAHGIVGVGSVSAAAFGWLFLMRGSLRKAALGFRPVLDIALDVDNWLREHPQGNNPRVRISGRYVSLLRSLCEWRDEGGRPYDAIVIIAHSQGTVITADLLRFLAVEPDPALTRLGGALPITFFTMGCPLRQLYGRRFPRLYGWATHRDVSPMAGWVADDLVANPVRPAAVPDPASLRVARWVNAYRSGDYIGRYLWRTDGCHYLWAPDLFHDGEKGNSTDASSHTAAHSRVEFCIGAGAHTHYWDEYARPIAWALDDLIAGA